MAIDEELYVRIAGDGVIVATPLGSSAYSMAVGRRSSPTGTQAFAVHAAGHARGSAPPLVVPADATLTVDVDPGYAGFDVEIDGRAADLEAPATASPCTPTALRLVTFATTGRGLTGLRRRGIIADSPRILASPRGPTALSRSGRLDRARGFLLGRGRRAVVADQRPGEQRAHSAAAR